MLTDRKTICRDGYFVHISDGEQTSWTGYFTQDLNVLILLRSRITLP